MSKINKNIHFLNNDEGFSLMETLVAVFILSIVSLISLNIMSNFASANQILTETIGHLEDLKTAQNYIRNDMQHIIKRQTRIISTGQPNIVLRFTRNNRMLADVDKSRAAIETIEYRIEEGELIRRSFDRPNPTVNTPYRDYTILHNVENVELRFLIGNNWVDEWVSSPNSMTSYLPKAIEFSWNIIEGSDQSKYHYVSKFKMGENL